MSERLVQHADMTSRFDAMGDDEIVTLIESTEPDAGWGLSRTIAVDGRDVFVKSLPLTDLELDHPGSTRNLFDLPVNYQYGVGSAGFGSAREVAVHERVTRWVVDGAISHFPLLHHQRALPLARQTRIWPDDARERYLERWGRHPSIERFIDARSRSTHALVTFAEHVPHTLMYWLPDNQSQVGHVIEQGLSALALLRQNGVAHLDANPSNIMTDGDQIFFSDFGLALDESFDLAGDERAFLRSHRHFDVGEFLLMLAWQPPERRVEFGPEYLAAVAPYHAIIEEMSAVFGRLSADPTSDPGYDDRVIERLLADAT